MQDFHESVWVAPGAQLYGKIAIGEGSSIWPCCVIRCECHSVRIGRMTNLQDFVMIHVGYAEPTVIGDFCSITHHATVHGATVEDDCLIGINAVVMNRAVIGRGSIVAPGAVVTEGTVIPPHSIVAGVPARVVKSARLHAREPDERVGLPPQRARLRARRAPRVGRSRLPALGRGEVERALSAPLADARAARIA